MTMLTRERAHEVLDAIGIPVEKSDAHGIKIHRAIWTCSQCGSFEPPWIERWRLHTGGGIAGNADQIWLAPVTRTPHPCTTSLPDLEPRGPFTSKAKLRRALRVWRSEGSGCEHRTSIEKHSCWRGLACQTTAEVHCICGWGQGASCRTHAEALAIGHRQRPQEAPLSVAWQKPRTADTTDDQLRDLFSRHCECRPIDLSRNEDDHAANHDCDTEILHDVQIALGIVLFDDIGRNQAIHQARARCAEIIHASQTHLHEDGDT